MLRGSDRAGASVADLRDAMPLRDWLRVAVPPSLAGNAFDPHLGQHFIPIVYVGVVTCALAIVGAIFAWRRIGGRVALLIASIVFAHLPLPLVRYPARLVPFGALAIVAIAVEGWDVIATRSFSPRAGRRWRAAPDEGRHPAEFTPPPALRPTPPPARGGGPPILPNSPLTRPSATLSPRGGARALRSTSPFSSPSPSRSSSRTSRSRSSSPRRCSGRTRCRTTSASAAR